jgi:UDP-N-acetylglucosamine 4-epimerase
VACGERTTLRELFGLIRERVARAHPEAARRELTRREPRPGDIRHSLADIAAARSLLDYHPTHTLAAGLDGAAPWYLSNLNAE